MTLPNRSFIPADKVVVRSLYRSLIVAVQQEG